MIDFVFKEQHFFDHMEPVYELLKEQHDDVRLYDKHRKVERDPYRVAVCSSYGDLRRCQDGARSIVFMEHGAGQTYSNRHTSYAGGDDRDNVVLFLNPGPHAAFMNRRYKEVKQAEIGCPKLDHWHRRPKKQRAGKPVVAISFHFHAPGVSPECSSAFFFYRSILSSLAKQSEYELLLHCHPRARKMTKAAYDLVDAPFVADFKEVLEKADLYVCDNSSTIFEFASTDRPVILLNCPEYRRKARHGLRFWDAAHIGRQCNRPEDLHGVILDSLSDTAEKREQRVDALKKVYYRTDGHAAKRAVEAIQEVIMAEKLAREQSIRLKALVACEGKNFGKVGPNYVVELTPTTTRVWDYRGRMKRPIVHPIPINPGREAAKMTEKVDGRVKMFDHYREEAADEKKEEKKDTPLKEDKKLDKPRENKGREYDQPGVGIEVKKNQEDSSPESSETTEPETVVEPETEQPAEPEQPETSDDEEKAQAEKMEQLKNLIVKQVKAGKNKTNTISYLGGLDRYTHRESHIAWDTLEMEGVLKKGQSPGEWVVD